MERLFLLTARSRGLPVWARYGATTALVLFCLGLRFWLFGPGPGVPFLLFFPAIITAGVIFDRGTGIYATLLSALLANYFFIEPVRSLQIVRAADLVSLAAFTLIALFTASVLEALHITLKTLAGERADLARANAELAEAAKQRGTLLGEAVHRARNDLQRLAATLTLQAGTTGEPAAKAALADATDRVLALARINTRLDRHRDDGKAEVDSREFIAGLIEDIRDAAVGLRPVSLIVEAEAHRLSMARAVPIGMVVNELVGNALKYAFPGEIEGEVVVSFRREGEHFVLTVTDDGVGGDPAAPPKGSGLGTRISKALAAQLRGQLEVAPEAPESNRPGLRWTITFPTAERG
jgi:two-component sensor histidine kinase